MGRRLRLVGLPAIGGLATVTAIGLLWLLGVVTALARRGTWRDLSEGAPAQIGMKGLLTLRGVVLLLMALVVIVLVRHKGRG